MGEITVKMTLDAQGSPGWGIAVLDDVKLCALSVSPCYDPFADADDDKDVDQEDFGLWQVCYTGDFEPPAAEPQYPVECDCFDRDSDNDIGESDRQAFEDCWSGPGIKADVSCDDPPPPP